MFLKGISATSTPKKPHQLVLDNCEQSSECHVDSAVVDTADPRQLVLDNREQSLLSVKHKPDDIAPTGGTFDEVLEFNSSEMDVREQAVSLVIMEQISKNLNSIVTGTADVDQPENHLEPVANCDLIAQQNPLLLVPLYISDCVLPVFETGTVDVLPTASCEIFDSCVSLYANTAQNTSIDSQGLLPSFDQSLRDNTISSLPSTPCTSMPPPVMPRTTKPAISKRTSKVYKSCAGVVTRSRKQNNDTNISPIADSPAVKRVNKKKKDVSYTTNFVDIPSGSEDSALSCSDNNDESEVLVQSAKAAV